MDAATILISAVPAAVTSLVTALGAAKLTAKQEALRWRAEAAQKYAELVSANFISAHDFARQFAVGVLIVETGDREARSKIFIAPNMRMVAGRGNRCEIFLPSQFACRHHFAISAIGQKVYVENMGSANGVSVNNIILTRPKVLNDRDVLRVGDDGVSVEFRAVPRAAEHRFNSAARGALFPLESSMPQASAAVRTQRATHTSGRAAYSVRLTEYLDSVTPVAVK